VDVGAALAAPAGVSISSGAVNIAAPVTAGFVSIASQAARPIDLGTETTGALSLTQAELALIAAPTLLIGNSSSGPVTVSAPLTLPAVQHLSLVSGGAITQSAGAPILLTATNSQGQRIGDLTVTTTNGRIDLRAANEVPSSISGSAGGTNDFDFNNALPMRLQQATSATSTGKLRITSGLFVPPLPAAPPEPEVEMLSLPPTLQAQLIAALDAISDINSVLEETGAEDRKKQEEEKKKKQVCQ
jgi:hypothetical protein